MLVGQFIEQGFPRRVLASDGHQVNLHVLVLIQVNLKVFIHGNCGAHCFIDLGETVEVTDFKLESEVASALGALDFLEDSLLDLLAD